MFLYYNSFFKFFMNWHHGSTNCTNFHFAKTKQPKSVLFLIKCKEKYFGNEQLKLIEMCELHQNLYWKLGQQAPYFGTILAYLETTA